MEVVNFDNINSLYLERSRFHNTIFPSVSPDIIPPFCLSLKDVTGLLCYLNTLEHVLPFQYPKTPLPIPVITASGTKAIQ